MAGHSGTPVIQKPGTQPGFWIFVAGAPAAYDGIVGKLQGGVTIAPLVPAIHVFLD